MKPFIKGKYWMVTTTSNYNHYFMVVIILVIIQYRQWEKRLIYACTLKLMKVLNEHYKVKCVNLTLHLFVVLSACLQINVIKAIMPHRWIVTE